MVPIEPAEPVTRDMEVITELLSRLHAEHRALTRPIAGAGLDASVLGQRSGWAARRSGDPARETVTAVAYRWGFSNPSRFTAYYRRAYGTVPSQTLSK
jgi:AraC-like DNA-binding protein